jgi:hypothetical protein
MEALASLNAKGLLARYGNKKGRKKEERSRKKQNEN